jgi:undecaprenyl phosphate N,N'-diacetylbacillosamine 1-phosphate transferase
MNSNLKNLIDKLVAILTLALMLPVILIICIVIFLSMGKPIFFTQDRPGKNCKIFKMYKFRTMKVSSIDVEVEKRITSVGRFLRSTSLDEIPELINVLKGEMSLVGPRPLLIEYLTLYDEKQIQRHNVLPGITGLAQVKGRNTLSWKNKFRYDLFYVEHESFLFDLYILYKTIIVVFTKSGFRANGEDKKFQL